MKTKLEIKDLNVSVEGKKILKGLNLEVGQGEVHAIMGPNGSGKTTLAHALMGSSKYTVDSGSVKLDGKDILSLSPDQRASGGLFLAFQYPLEIPGVGLANFLRLSVNSLRKKKGEKPLTILEFKQKLEEKMSMLKMKKDFAARSLNTGFSGGEKKLCEILQLALFLPKIAILDETDSGLDIDALKNVSSGVNSLRGPNTGFLIITHYQRILDYIKPDFVHILYDGKIIKSGDYRLAQELEGKGYDEIVNDTNGVMTERMAGGI